MARINDAIPSQRIRIEGSRKRGVNTRHDKVFSWLDSIPAGQRFAFAWELLAAALNGELGPAMQTAIEENDLSQAIAAASQISSAFVVDDDE